MIAPSYSMIGTLVEAKMCTFTLETTHFVFNKCPTYNHDGASAKFCTNSHEMDYSEGGSNSVFQVIGEGGAGAKKDGIKYCITGRQ